jgi:hypothetical protein
VRARWLAYLSIACGSLACSATCLRDSDCIGEALCVQDRCLLVVGAVPADAAPSSSRPSEPDGMGGAAPVQGTGGGATAPRDILDASTDATLSAGDP